MYARRPQAFDAHAERLLQLFAEQAAVLLANTRALSQARGLTAALTDALRTRDVVSEAKGILLARGAADGAAAQVPYLAVGLEAPVLDDPLTVLRQILAGSERAAQPDDPAATPPSGE